MGFIGNKIFSFQVIFLDADITISVSEQKIILKKQQEKFGIRFLLNFCTIIFYFYFIYTIQFDNLVVVMIHETQLLFSISYIIYRETRQNFIFEISYLISISFLN